MGVLLLALVTLLGAAAVGATLPSVPEEPPPSAALRLDADAASDRLTVRHVAGDDLDVADLDVTVTVDGDALAHQPPVPFFAARGFVSGPTGPFNHAGGTTWRAGQRGTLRIASTNDPQLSSGDRVTVTVTTDRDVVAKLSTIAS